LNTDEIRGRRADLYRRYILDAEALATHLNTEPGEAVRAVETAFTRCFARLDHRRDESTFELTLFREVVELSNQFGRAGRTRVVEGLRRVLQLSVPQTANILGLSEGRVADIEADLPEEAPPVPEPDPSMVMSTDKLRRVAHRAAWRRDLTVIGMVVLAAAIGVASWGPWERARQNLADAQNGLVETVTEDGLVFAGKVDGKKWDVRVHKRRTNICMDLDVAREFETSHCLRSFDLPLRAFVDPDRRHQTTFIFGYARRKVGSLRISEREGAPINVELVPAPDNLGRKEPAQMFVVTLPEALLHLDTAEQGQNLGHQIYRLRLVAKDKSGARLGHQEIILGRPT